MTKVFVSYSRKDRLFAGKFTDALHKSDMETWIDWEDIPATADWLDQIHKGIEQSDSFLFLLSPDSIMSDICRQEVDHAVQNAKRLVPIVVRDVDAHKVHPALAKVNWIYCREQDDFDRCIEKTLKAIRTDLAWVEFHRRLQIRALEWERRGDRSLLLRGKDLREAEVQLASVGQKDPHPTDLQRQYVLAGRRGEGRTRNLILVIGAVTLVALSFLSIFANNQRILAQNNEETALANAAIAETERANAIIEANRRGTAQANAEEQARIARARELAAVARGKSESQLDLSLLLSVEAFHQNDNYQTRGILLDNLQISPNLNQLLSGHTAYPETLLFSQNGKFLVSSSCALLNVGSCLEIKIILWDMETKLAVGQPIFIPVSRDAYPRLYFGPNDNSIYVDVETVRYKLDIAKISSAKDFVSVENVPSLFGSFEASPDGLTLARANNNVITLYDPAAHREIGELKADMNIGRITHLAFSRDNKVLISGGCLENDTEGHCLQSQIIVWDLNSHTILGDPYAVSGEIRALSPYGQIVAVTNQDNGIDFIDALANRRINHYISSSDAQVSNVFLSPNEKKAALLMVNGLIFLWDLSTGQQIGEPLPGVVPSYSNVIIFSPDGEILATRNTTSNNVMLWNTTGRRPLFQTMASKPDTAYIITFSSDGILHSVEGNHVLHWNVTTGARIGVPRNITGKSYVLDPDGRMLASILENGDTMISDLNTGQPITKLDTQFTDSYQIAFSPNRNLIVSASCEQDGCEYLRLVKVWDIFNQDRVYPLSLPLEGDISSVSFSPNGKMLAVGNCLLRGIVICEIGEIQLWDTETRQFDNPLSVESNEGVISIALDHKGKFLASGTDSGKILLWDMKARRTIGESLQTYANYIIFSPDDKFLVSADFNYLSFWDVESHQRIGQPLKINARYRLESLAFSRDGKILVISGCNLNDHVKCEQGNILLVDASPESWTKKACGIAGRNFTRAEWAFYIPYKPYPATRQDATCPQWALEPKIMPSPVPIPTLP